MFNGSNPEHSAKLLGWAEKKLGTRVAFDTCRQGPVLAWDAVEGVLHRAEHGFAVGEVAFGAERFLYRNVRALWPTDSATTTQPQSQSVSQPTSQPPASRPATPETEQAFVLAEQAAAAAEHASQIAEAAASTAADVGRDLAGIARSIADLQTSIREQQQQLQQQQERRFISQEHKIDQFLSRAHQDMTELRSELRAASIRSSAARSSSPAPAPPAPAPKPPLVLGATASTALSISSGAPAPSPTSLFPVPPHGSSLASDTTVAPSVEQRALEAIAKRAEDEDPCFSSHRISARDIFSAEERVVLARLPEYILHKKEESFAAKKRALQFLAKFCLRVDTKCSDADEVEAWFRRELRPGNDALSPSNADELDVTVRLFFAPTTPDPLRRELLARLAEIAVAIDRQHFRSRDRLRLARLSSSPSSAAEVSEWLKPGKSSLIVPRAGLDLPIRMGGF